MTQKPKAKARNTRGCEISINHRADHVHDLLSLFRSIFEGSFLPLGTAKEAKRIVSYVNSAVCLVVGKDKHQLSANPFAKIEYSGDGMHLRGANSNRHGPTSARAAYFPLIA
jgi:hypothetical protein